MEYIFCLVGSGAAKTARKSAQLALVFLEEAGEVPADQRVSAHASVANIVEEARLTANV